MKDTITELLASKKFLAFAVSALLIVLSPIVGWFGYEIDPEKLALLVGTAATYILSQGLADHGSTAAKINAASVVSMDAQHDTMVADKPITVEVAA